MGKVGKGWAYSGKAQAWHGNVGSATFTAPTDDSISGGKHSGSCGRVQEKSWNVSVPPKDSTPPHLSLVTHALGTSSAQILSAVVSEEELDAISPVLDASSTQSPRQSQSPGFLVKAVHAFDCQLKKSPSPFVTVLVHVCILDDPDDWDADVSLVHITPSSVDSEVWRQLNTRQYSLSLA